MMCAVFVLSLLLLAGCGRYGQGETAQDTAPDGRPKVQVITTIFPPFDFVRRIGGDYVEVNMLLKPGMEAHSMNRPPGILSGSRKAICFCMREASRMYGWRSF